MTMPSRHGNRNSNSGCLRPSTLPLGHGGSAQYNFLPVSEEETFVSLKPQCQSGGRTSDLRLSKQAALATAPGPRPKSGK